MTPPPPMSDAASASPMSDAASASAAGSDAASAAGSASCSYGDKCNNISCKLHPGDEAFQRTRSGLLLTNVILHTDKRKSKCNKDTLTGDGSLKFFCVNSCCEFTHHPSRVTMVATKVTRFLKKDDAAASRPKGTHLKGSA